MPNVTLQNFLHQKDEMNGYEVLTLKEGRRKLTKFFKSDSSERY